MPMSRFTGRRINDYDAMLQSLAVLFTTRFKTRVMRREVGSDVPNLVDKSLVRGDLIDWYAAIAKTVYDFEPRYSLKKILVDVSELETGHIYISLQGKYIPTSTAMNFENIALRVS